MTTQKQPQAGEWWTCKGTRVRIVGLHSGGDYVCELEAGDLTILPLGRTWQHLPDCTGWEWQPEVWPKWYVLDETQGVCKVPWYIKRTSENECLRWGLNCDGVTFGFESQTWKHQSELWIEVTEAEALARVTPPETFPQYWTAINDVLYAYCERFEPNKYRMVKRDGTVMSDSPWLLTHGQGRTQLTKEQAEALLDKPQESPPQPSPKRVPVRLWVSHNDGSLDVQYGDDNPSSHMDEYEEIKHDANGFYVEVQP